MLTHYLLCRSHSQQVKSYFLHIQTASQVLHLKYYKFLRLTLRSSALDIKYLRWTGVSLAGAAPTRGAKIQIYLVKTQKHNWIKY